VVGLSLLVAVPPSETLVSVLPSRAADVPSLDFAEDPVAQLACAPTTAPPTTSMRKSFLKSTLTPSGKVRA
jgi:hypothetical protein